MVVNRNERVMVFLIRHIMYLVYQSDEEYPDLLMGSGKLTTKGYPVV